MHSFTRPARQMKRSRCRILFLPFTSTSGSSSIFILLFSVMRLLLSSETPDRLNKIHTEHNTHVSSIPTVTQYYCTPPSAPNTHTYKDTRVNITLLVLKRTLTQTRTTSHMQTFHISHARTHTHTYKNKTRTQTSTTMARQAGLYRSGSQGKDRK